MSPERDHPSVERSGSLKGQLLVAAPLLTDANFDRTVVLLIEHTSDGAVGVVLNRPSLMPVADAVPGWADAADAPGLMFFGGPVEPMAVVAIGCRRPGVTVPEGLAIVDHRFVVLDLHQLPIDIDHAVDGVRMFMGYAGWEASQLEEELEHGAWIVVEADRHDLVEADAEELWRKVLARQPGRLSMLANFPPHPSDN